MTLDEYLKLIERFNTSPLKDFGINKVLEYLQKTVSDYRGGFIKVALMFLGIFLSLELIKEAISLAHGDGFHLGKKLITWVIIMILISSGVYTYLGEGVFASARSLGEYAYDQWGRALETFYDNANKNKPSFGVLAVLSPQKLVEAFGYALSLVVGIICFFLIYLMVCGAYACLALLILVGPVAIVFMLNDDFRGIAIKWINSIINYLIVIPIYGVTIVIVADIMGAGMNAAAQTMITGNMIAQVMILLFAPMISLGVVFQGPKAVMSLIGGVGGGGEMAAGALGAMAGFAGRGMLRSSWNQTKAALSGAYKSGGRWGGGGGGQGSPGGVNPTAGGGGGQGGGMPGAPNSGGGGNQKKGFWDTFKDIGSRVAPHFFRPLNTIKTRMDKTAEGAQPHHSWPSRQTSQKSSGSSDVPLDKMNINKDFD